MAKILPGYDVVSLWGIAQKTKQLKQKINQSAKKGLIISLVSAFFIVVVFALLLNLAENALINTTKISLAQTEEKTAFVPGQFVSDIIKNGYLGR